MATKPTSSKFKRIGKKKKKTGGGGSGGGSGGGGHGGGGDGDDREPIGEAPENLDIHEAYLQYRLGGGERATTQAYARAFAQFKKMPGAVRGKPAVIPPDPSDKDSGKDPGDEGPDKDAKPQSKGDAP